jgi:hypothetical protein
VVIEMTMELALWLIFGGVAVVTVGLLAVALSRGRVRPVRTVPWVVAAILMLAGLLLNIAVTVGGLLTAPGEITWLLPASLALLAATILLFVEPRWAAWTLAVTSIVLPALVLAATLIVDNPELGRDLLGAMLMFYSVRSLAAAGLLWWATTPARGARPQASPSPERRSESAPIG